MIRLQSLKDQLNDIERELGTLKNFRLTTALKRFKRQLEGEASVIRAKIVKLQETEEERKERHKRRLETANRNRSSKNKRVWKYVKSIQENYHPELSLKEIRSQLKRHKQGLETEVSDVAWRNPSP